MNLKKCLTLRKLIVLDVIGIILIAIGAGVGFGYFPTLVENTVDDNIKLQFDTPQYERFLTLPFPLTFNVYLFNVTNVPEIMAGGKPEVQEVGPFVYKEYLEKKDVNYDYITETLNFEQHRRYYFDEESSKPLTESTKLTFLNIPLNSLMQMTPDLVAELQNPHMIHFVDEIIPKIFYSAKDLFYTKSVDEVLWKGIRLCEERRMVNFPNGSYEEFAKTSCNVMRLQGPKNIDSSNPEVYYFSLLKYKNNTNDGVFTIDAGIKDIQQVGQILKWDGMTDLPYWTNTGQCNKLQGLDGTVFPPRIDDTSTFDIYATDICRSSRLKYVGEVEYKGVSGLRYEVTEEAFSASEPTNACYCINTTVDLEQERNCLPDGFLDLFTCQKAPILASNPHMLWGDDRYYETTGGQSRDANVHKNFLELEPTTGTPLRGSKKVQFNMYLQRVENITTSYPFTQSPSVLPFMWVEESVELPDFLVEELKHSLSTIGTLDVITWIIISIGIILVLLSICGYFYMKSNGKM